MEIIKSFKDNNVRVILIDNEPYFASVDVCNILEIGNVSQAMTYLDKDDLTTNDAIDSLGRKTKINYVNEGGLYQLIFRSRKESAKAFKKWVTHEVLPSIRKTGKYSLPESLKNKSKTNRNLLTSEWQAHGISNPKDFARLTIAEYKSLEFKDGERKKDFSKEQILTLAALEAMESLNLFMQPELKGLGNLEKSVTKTAGKVIEHKKVNKIS